MSEPAQQDYATAFCEPCHRGLHLPMTLASAGVVCICCAIAMSELQKAERSEP